MTASWRRLSDEARNYAASRSSRSERAPPVQLKEAQSLEDRTSPGGIAIPDTAAEKPVHGKIIAVGTGKILESGHVRPCDLKVGDKILFGKYSGTEVRVEGEELLVMRRGRRHGRD
jgi:chaperonin GroES